ncbi:UDP-N-acetylmuramate dehydrogenase [Lactobacillus kefiranofaciens]|uniref:UDP-N-acetylenolpyruvoylglucosamine reductase n=1 Tax=Lactobacillus kefiranofaciens TaxID=267818 RepID=A0AAX3UEW8_9LACO|nr:UDP-N-acetylmuramate dehydrogenase [Lactobacillus kefiranofaciens]AEG40640.1 UDP-N-acetylenolpyruvoylglucosamine reductase [Lactobacillus kefiranofaciens subsp. kefiranofaciens]KRL28948.1 UDP-N-acetylenolpyruvoylglucosamine reductase [Lactobacillus kefiranofaciens subsp. kefirgranum DSM 10550 = JCM 8572]KRM22649.1 UDP-N-acetylenolpyruvoylglucosamine reductase [Lactobacillus kefiranofaciens subsp. kefiranofaciens DSM 5016 = JCM 6985]MCJ2171709.1 UDP-N-acetylmuramate dehydrogenase [Lactobacill
MELLDLKKQGIDIKEQIPLSRYTFTKTGGPAEYLAFPKNTAEVEKLVKATRIDKIPLTIIGNASNLIIRDGGIDGLVIILTELKEIKVEGNQVTADAGARIIDTAFAAAHHGLSGMEFAAGIPGSIGGGVFMNAGAYGSEMQEVVDSVHVLTRSGEFKTYSNQEMNFSYRHSIVQETGDIVLTASFKLVPKDRLEILDQMHYLNALRRYKQPLEYPSCGSVFKRPTGHFVGPMIIKAGLQGKKIGGAQDSTKHAGFIVNKGGATATDYLNLIHLIQRVIKEKFGIDLHTEVRIIGKEK